MRLSIEASCAKFASTDSVAIKRNRFPKAFSSRRLLGPRHVVEQPHSQLKEDGGMSKATNCAIGVVSRAKHTPVAPRLVAEVDYGHLAIADSDQESKRAGDGQLKTY